MKNLISKEEKDRIDSICKEYKIKKYKINPDGSIDVSGEVSLSLLGLTKIPLKFNNVTGDFKCYGNNLTSLEGAPITVGGNFDCESNVLISLFGSPITVGGDFCTGYNNLNTLEGIAVKIGGVFRCGNNKLITTYSGDTDIDVDGDIVIIINNLPRELMNNQQHIRLILKFQRPFMIWNEDLTLNAENFADLISEIEEGLE